MNPKTINKATDSIFQVLGGGSQLVLWANNSTQFLGTLYSTPNGTTSDGIQNGNSMVKNAEGDTAAFSSTDLSDSWHLYELVFDSGGNAVEMYLDGSLVDTGSWMGPLSSTGTLGLMYTTNGQRAEGYWGELIFVEDASSTDATNIRNYLMYKWAIGSTSNPPLIPSTPT